MGEKIIEVALVIISASAIWDFVKFLINRKDTKSANLETLKAAIDKLSEKVDRNQAILARTHILRFDDELLNDIKHSKEYFAQQLQDIDVYESYCAEHPEFKNSYASAAIDHVKATYKKLLEEHKL